MNQVGPGPSEEPDLGPRPSDRQIWGRGPATNPVGVGAPTDKLASGAAPSDKPNYGAEFCASDKIGAALPRFVPRGAGQGNGSGVCSICSGQNAGEVRYETMTSAPSDGYQPQAKGRALRLVDVLRALPERELESLIERLRIGIDEAKRIDVPSQSRALSTRCQKHAISKLPRRSASSLPITEARGGLVVEVCRASRAPRCSRFVFARGRRDGVELLLPIATGANATGRVRIRGGSRIDGTVDTGGRGQHRGAHLGRPATPKMALPSSRQGMADRPGSLTREMKRRSARAHVLRAARRSAAKLTRRRGRPRARADARRGATGATRSERRGFRVRTPWLLSRSI